MPDPAVAPLDLGAIRERLAQMPRFGEAHMGDMVDPEWLRAETLNDYQRLLSDAEALVTEVQELRTRVLEWEIAADEHAAWGCTSD